MRRSLRLLAGLASVGLALPNLALAGEPPAEITLKGYRWLPFSGDSTPVFTVAYRVGKPGKVKKANLLCGIQYALATAGNGKLDDSDPAWIGGRLELVTFGMSLQDPQDTYGGYRIGSSRGLGVTISASEAEAAEGTIAARCRIQEGSPEGIGVAVIYLANKGDMAKIVSNKVVIPVAAGAEAQRALEARLGPATEATPTPPTAEPAATATPTNP